MKTAPTTVTIQSKANATPEEIATFYKSLRLCGCNAKGTLTLTYKGIRKSQTFTFKGWAFIERSEGGALIAEHPTYKRHTFTL